MDSSGNADQNINPQTSKNSGGASAKLSAAAAQAIQQATVAAVSAGGTNDGTAGQQLAYSVVGASSEGTNVQLENGQTIFIPASAGQVQMVGNQIITAAPAGIASAGQTIIRGVSSQSGASIINTSQGQIQLGSVAQGVQIRQPGGQVVQTVQLPVGAPIQQTIAVQIPISSANGQTVMQTVNIPLSALQSVAQGSVQTVTAQVMPTSQPTTIKAETSATSGSNQAASNATITTAPGQTILGQVNLGNGQIGHLVAAAPQQTWPANAINLGTIPGQQVIQMAPSGGQIIQIPAGQQIITGGVPSIQLPQSSIVS